MRNKKPYDKGKAKLKTVPNTKGNKQQRRSAEVIDTAEREYRSATNDFSWYNAFPTFTQSAGTVPFSTPLGDPVRVKSGNMDYIPGQQFYYPGVMRIGFIPTIGRSADRTSPINQSAIRVMTYMRQAQKASAKYDSQDMMMAFMALDSCYTFHAWMKRLYGLLNISSPMNKYYSSTLLAANGVSPTDFKLNAAKLLNYINKFAINLGAMTVPRDFDLVVRHEWMVSGIYLDADDIKGQLYMFVPAKLYQYSNTEATGSKLTPVEVVKQNPAGDETSNALKTVDQIITLGESLLNAIMGDEDIATICGDFYNALGREGVKQLSEIEPSYTVLPSYDQRVLSQIENLILLPRVPAGLDITQDPSVNNGAIIQKPYVQLYKNNKFQEMTMAYSLTPPTLNCRGGQPTPEDVIEMSRLVAVINPEPESTDKYYLQAFGSEIVVWLGIFSKPYGLPDLETPYANVSSYSNVTLSGEDLQTSTPSNQADFRGNELRILRWYAKLSLFDWHPRLPLYTWYTATPAQATSGEIAMIGIYGDVDNVVVVEREQIARMHQACLSSLFNLPQMGFTVRN